MLRLHVQPENPSLADTIASTASTIDPVLLWGPRGPAMDEVARIIHKQSTRSGGPFEIVRCGLYPKATLEAQFFGRLISRRSHIRTAHGLSRGRVEAAAGGTLFIDQVQNASPCIQAELLRIMREGRYLDPARATLHAADVRIVTSAWTDLEKRVNAGLFRRDLFQMLNVNAMHVPRNGAAALEVSQPISRPAQRAREIQHEIWLPDEKPAAGVYDKIVHRLQQLLIEQTLEKCDGIQARAAELLGVSVVALEAKRRTFDQASRGLNAA